MKWLPEQQTDEAPWSGWAPRADLDQAREIAAGLEEENARLRQALTELRAHIAGAVAVGDAWKLKALDMVALALGEQAW